MRIFIINPDYGMTRADMDARCAILAAHAAPDTELHMECLTRTKVEIDSEADVVMAGPEILAMACQAERDGYDAVVLYCFSDPAIGACRESVSIPVAGGCGAACAMAHLLGRRAGVILTNEGRIPEKQHFLRSAGLLPPYLGPIGAVSLSAPVWDDRDGALRALIREGRRMKDEHQADVLILGCLSFLGLGGPLSRAVGIPVVDPAIAAVNLAESMARQRNNL